MVLYGEHRLTGQANAAVGIVEERDVSLNNTVRQRLGVDCEAVVHRHDLNLAGRMILDRMVGAMMPLMHLLCLCAESEREDLVSQADAEDWQLGLQKLLNDRNCILAGRGRVARSV